MGIWSYTCIVHCLAFLFGLIPGSSFVLGTSDVLDLLKFVKQTNYTLTYVPGSEPHMTAILFQDTNRILELPEDITQKVLMLLRKNEHFTFLATVRQEPGESGSLISLSAGQHRFLEVESDGKRDEIHVHYPRDQHLYSETFPVRIADGHWHQLALTFSSNSVILYLNCNKRYQRVLFSLNRQYLTGSKLSLFIGQRNQNSLYFKGAIQELKFVIGQQGYRRQCPRLSESLTMCPKCAQFQVSESLQTTMNSLYNTFSKIDLIGDTQAEVEERCKCMEPCPNVGNIWEKDECTLCNCGNDTVECRYNDACSNTCLYENIYFNHNEVVCPGKTGEFCTCYNGFVNCEVCPPLDCDISEQIQGEECCPKCKGTGFCALGNDCPANSTCIDQQTQYTCLCNHGFHRNGDLCEDVNECSTIGGPKGHHCSRDQTCINTIGSYKCVCSPGLSKKGDNSCSPATLSSGQTSLFRVSHETKWTNMMLAIIWLCLCVRHIIR
ncbi:calcium ion binding [Mactra antiquata]